MEAEMSMELWPEQEVQMDEDLQQVIQHLMRLERHIASLEVQVEAMDEQLQRLSKDAEPDSLIIRGSKDEEN